MDEAKIMEIVQSATRDVFQTMLSLDVQPGDSFVEQGAMECHDGLVAIVGIAGQWAGMGSLYCTADLAMLVTSTMFMSAVQEVNVEVLDSVSELANMIMGNVKSMLEYELGPLHLSIPTVIYGRNYRAMSGGSRKRLVVPFECGESHMNIKLCLIERTQDAGFGTRSWQALHV